MPRELLLQQQLQLLDAAVDAVAAHLLHHGLAELRGTRASAGGRGAGGAGARGGGGRRTYSVFLFGAEQLHGHGAGGHAWRREAAGERGVAGGGPAGPI